MSLKAKIEAVIYASEEPVTLTQLTGLLGEEGQAELDDLADMQQTLSLDENVEDEPVEADEADAVEPEEAADDVEAEVEAAEAETSAEAETVAGDETEAGGEAQVRESGSGAPESEVSQDALAVAEKVDDKKATRERERKLREYFRSLLETLIADYVNSDRGLEIREVAGGYRLATKPEYHDAVRGFVKSLKPPLKLSLQALETLAVIAYKQPVTAPEISEIRGVDSGGVLGSLITRKLIATGGRKQVIGRPILYKTTKDFLLRFGLKDISELPSIEEFEKMAGELNEAVQEEMQMDDAADARNSSEEDAAAGTPTSVDELNSAAEPTNTLHESVEDLESDQSSAPEGHKREHADPNEVEPGEVEPSADIHEPQADGDSDDPSEDDEAESESKTGGV
jgi:segregation and condensation protein B